MAAGHSYRGVVVPMISPFTADGNIDQAAVGRIVTYLVGNKIAGIFPLGTTGESASIHPKDKPVLVEATVKAVAARTMVYAGISGTCLRESVEAAARYKSMGVNAVVAHVSSYYPLSDAEIEAYFFRLADRVPLPLVLYNIPITTHHSISLDSIDRLRQHPNIVALKDSANDPERVTQLLGRTGGRDGFPVLLGSSSQFTLGLKHGGVGLVPSGGHLVANLYQSMFESAMADQWEAVEQFQRETDAACARYIKGRSIGQGLAVLKALMEQRGLCGRTMLPPILDFTGSI